MREHIEPFGELMSPGGLVGIAESLVQLLVAFASLTAAWLMVAVGMRRSS